MTVMAGSPTRLEKLLPLLACPSCRGGLQREKEGLRCSRCKGHFGITAGRPVFMGHADDVQVMPAQHISNQPPDDVMDWLTWFDGEVLNIGAGGTQLKLDNCVELETCIFRNTDVVADAHQLPFADEAFDAVITFNTFEHLRDPRQAAGEIHRVLKPGGRVILQTAFLQPVHEAPYHFYNTTEYGLRRWFDGFTINKVEVSKNFNPAYVIAWLVTELVTAVEATLGKEAADQLAATPLSHWKTMWQKPAERKHPVWQMLDRLPQDVQKRLAAGFHLEAVK